MTFGLFWNTYRGDFEWYKVSARSYKKFATGFTRARCLVPKQDFELFRQFNEPLGIETVGHPDAPGKGFLKHEIIHCWADNLMPGCDWIAHIDADCVFAKPSAPMTWFEGDKNVVAYRPYEDLLTEPIRPGEEVAFMGADGLKSEMNRGQFLWKWATEFALGREAKWEMMQSLPLFYPRGVYAELRRLMNERHGNWEEYVLSGRNEFPQTFAEFNTLGEVARSGFSEYYKFHYLPNTEFKSYPSWRGHVIQSWSRGGFDRIHDFASDGEGVLTPRSLFQKLGLI
jgi:hypothetical protein